MTRTKRLFFDIRHNVSTYVRKIKFVIIISFFSLMIVTTSCMIFYTYNQFYTEVTDVLEDHVDLFVDILFLRVQGFFSRVKGVACATGWMGLSQEQILNRRQSLSLQFMGLLNSFPHIRKLNISIADGSFFSVSQLRYRKKMYLFQPHLPLPTNTAFRVTFLKRSPHVFDKTCQYYDEEGILVASESKSFPRITENNQEISSSKKALLTTLYDPRTTKWYQEAKKQREFYWSDMYRYLGSGDIRMTAAQPMYDSRGKFVGVMSADILMVEISSLLKINSAGPVAASFLINQKGECFAYPVASAVATLTETGVELEKVEEINAFHISEAYKKYERDRSNRRFSRRKVSYLSPSGSVHFLKFPESFGAQWVLGVAIHTKQFTDPFLTIYKNSLIFCFGTLALATILLVLISKRISSPIEAVAESLRRIQSLDFNIKLNLRSSFYEIAQMIEALKSVMNGLNGFGKFVPKSLVRQLVRSGKGVHLGGEKRKLTILFSDIQGFTSISETVNPEILLFHLSDYFEEMTSLVMSNHGTLDKYIGDAIMAFWGAPIADERQSYRACRVALDCTERLKRLNEKWIQEGKPPLYTRFGINTGVVLVGNMGSSDRLQYTVLGDSVNLTARLEQLGKTYGTKILVSHSTYEEVQEDFVFRPVDLVAVKGKEKSVLIYELLGEQKRNPNDQTFTKNMNLAAKTQQAYTLYLNRQWDEAFNAYTQILENYPQDGLSHLFIKRCTELIKDPPPEGWDGTTRMTSK